MNSPTGRDRPRVVILGAGFAGLRLARSLRGTAVDVVVIDRQNHHLFQPLLYQVATAGLAAPDIAAPIRRVLRRNKSLRVIYGEVTKLEPDKKRVWLGDEALSYDILAIATGAGHSYFGRDEWAEFAPGLKTLRDAQDIRSRILRAFEAAERIEVEAERGPWLRFAVVGAGPTGVELAGALAELARKILPGDFRRFDSGMTEVLLIEGGPRVLSAYPEDLSQSAERQLEKLGVTVRCDARVTMIDADGISINEGERIAARTTIWAAGVQVSPILEGLGCPLDRAGRAHVSPDLSLQGQPDIYVLGDAAHVEEAGKQVPGVAPAAMQMGKHAAQSIRRRLAGKQSRPFRYRDKGSMATIGRASAVAEIGRLHLRGYAAWLAWLFVHLIFLVGFRSRIVVLINWAWAYIGYRPAARVLAELAEDGQAEAPPEKL